MRHCYSEALQRDPAPKGTLVVRFDLAPSGEIRSAEIRDSTIPGGDAVGACLVEHFLRWDWPAGHGEVVVRYPFTFRPAALPDGWRPWDRGVSSR